MRFTTSQILLLTELVLAAAKDAVQDEMQPDAGPHSRLAELAAIQEQLQGHDTTPDAKFDVSFVLTAYRQPGDSQTAIQLSGPSLDAATTVGRMLRGHGFRDVSVCAISDGTSNEVGF